MQNGKITSVEINNSHKLNADNVICNADPPNVYDQLINKQLQLTLIVCIALHIY